MKRKTKQFILLIGDIIILYISLYLALTLRHFKPVDIPTFKEHLLPFSIIYAIWLVVFFINDLYSLDVIKKIKELISKLVHIGVINAVIAIVLLYLIPSFGVAPKTNLILTVIISSILIIAWRLLCNQFVTPAKSKTNVLLIGFDKESEIVSKINSRTSFGYNVRQVIPNVTADLESIIREKEISIIVIKNDYYEKAAPYLYKFIPLGIDVYDFSTFWENFENLIPINIANEAWFLEKLRQKGKNFYEASKRIFDIFFSIILGLISLIFYPFIILGIKLTSPGPIFYKQKRVGKGGKIFKIWKFRTMIPNAEQNGAVWASKNDSRITKFGKFLRKTRLDELPQLWNILKGDMSFVGPRPERPEFIKELTQKIPHYHLRHLIKPGLTGWAQIKYPYGSSVKDSEQKLCYDLFYLKNRSFIFDLSILLKTIATVLSKKGR